MADTSYNDTVSADLVLTPRSTFYLLCIFKTTALDNGKDCTGQDKLCIFSIGHSSSYSRTLVTTSSEIALFCTVQSNIVY